MNHSSRNNRIGLKNFLIPIVLSSLGIILGIISLYEWNVYSKKTITADSLKILENRILLLENQIEALAQTESAQQEVTEKLITDLHSAIVQTRSDFITFAKRFVKAKTLSPPSSPSLPSTNILLSDERSSTSTLPFKATSDSTYTIEAGDTLNKIAQQKGLSVQQLMESNPTVNAAKLKIGQIIIIPNSSNHDTF